MATATRDDLLRFGHITPEVRIKIELRLTYVSFDSLRFTLCHETLIYMFGFSVA